jgi:hypothetical protein
MTRFWVGDASSASFADRVADFCIGYLEDTRLTANSDVVHFSASTVR